MSGRSSNRTRARGRAAVLGVALATLAACAGAPESVATTTSPMPSGAASPPVAPQATQTSGPAPSALSAAAAAPAWVRPRKLVVIVEENHSYSEAVATMPYLTGLARRYGMATRYSAVTHPSLPNYLAIAGGSTFGITDDNPPASHPLQGTSVFGQLLATRHTAKTYAEAMRVPCELHSDGRYAVKHNPWPYFSTPTERSACRRNDVPAGTPSAGALHDDVARGALPTLGFVVPDVCHDGHDCSTATADAWLKGWVPVLMRGSDYRAGRLVIVITFDEDDHTAANRVLTAVIHPSLTHRVVSVPRNHYSLSASISGLAGRTPLRRAASAPDLLSAFNL